jgi:hypothetical protein
MYPFSSVRYSSGRVKEPLLAHWVVAFDRTLRQVALNSATDLYKRSVLALGFRGIDSGFAIRTVIIVSSCLSETDRKPDSICGREDCYDITP